MELNIASLIIGRGGSSLKDKNILPILGHPLLHWTANAAIKSNKINKFFISSDCQKILKEGEKAGYKSIKRPKKLATDTSQSCDSVLHALQEMNIDEEIDIVVVQHANVATITTEMIDDCINILISNGPSKCSAVIPSHECPEYHPLRAQRLSKEGFLLPFAENQKRVSANRQDLPTAIFFDHSFWVLWSSSIKNAKKNKNSGSWPCMGEKIIPYITKGCFDIHDLKDIKKTEEWLIENKIETPNF